jgi:hypothetical protein
MPAGPVFCPECRGEYLASARECVDCGVPLVSAHELGSCATEALPPASELTCIRAASVGWAQALSERLAHSGISHRIEAVGDDEEGESVRRQPSHRLPYGVYVRSADVAAATAIDEAFFREQIPDLPEGHGVSGAPEVPEGCPACGEPAESDAAECPSCGLVLAVQE